LSSVDKIVETSAKDHRPPGHPGVKAGKIGVLLVNLGTPDDTSYWPMRRYLKEFLSDRRVIDTNRLLWWPILNGIILTIRPSRSGKAYASIWNTERNESPLRTFTRAQGEKLGAALAASDPRIVVDWSMRYGMPAIKTGIEALRAKGCDRILLFPLYPQYSAATNATVCDVAFDHLKTLRWQPALRVVPPYADDPLYIHALAGSIRDHVDALGYRPDMVLASFHGLPKRYLTEGDPYYCHCHKTARLLREALGWGEDRLKLTFQSRFGREEWLQPYTDDTLKSLAASGVKRVAVITPGFVSDCVETLEEIAEGSREAFLHAGGEAFTAIPCLNDSPAGMAVLESVVRRELAGWI
jgi:protoporphyrin/coproporphyrin ferrochelatase